ncbi:HPF/RaiA family ribosome-associated protein [Patescibacteria group bacterium]
MENTRFMYKGQEIEDQSRRDFVEDYILKRLEVIDRMIEKITKIDVEINLDRRGFYRVEIMVHTPRNMFRAQEVSESIEGSADIAVDELKTQIRRKKDKVWTKVMRGARSIRKKMSLDKDARF